MPTRPLAACLAALDPDPSRAGFEFEQVAAWWLTADPVWASRTKRVWRWAEWPGRTSGQDLGIDLVAELVGGGLLAVQVKHRADVPTREIDSFLAAAAGGPFTETMLLATTDGIAVNGRKKLLAAGAHIVGRFDLDRSPVSWPDGLDVAAAGREPARGVRPHQAAAVADTVAALEAGDRCRVVMACGTGKTLVAQRAAEKVAGTGLVVVAVPSLSLLKQTLESWARDSLTDGGLADWLAVCSDRTVADAPDPSEMPTVTTDPAAVTAWLARRKPKSVQRVVFVTHASLPVLADALTAADRTADLLVVDEAHRVAGRGQLAGLATGPFPTRRRVFLTATPRIYTAQAKSKADGDGVEIVSMDDEARFGPEAHHLTFANAVAAGLLCDFEIVVSIITDADTARLVGNRALAELDGVQDDTATLASHLAVARAAHDWNATRTISFHTRVAQAYWFAQDHPQLARLVNPAEVVAAEATSGAVPAGARQAALDRLRHLADADRRLLANARVLSEGVDVPAVDAVAFIDPKRSVIDIAQAVGRAMRTAPGKTRGLVIVPVHLPAGADPDTAADAGVWKPVWDTLRALRSIDERLAEELDQYRYQLGRRTGPIEAPARLHFHSVEPLGVRFVEAVTTAAVQFTTASWEEWFGLLEAYAAEHGHARPEPRYVTSGGLALGRWATKQRSLNYRGGLPADHRQRLDSVPGWLWDPYAADWEDGFARLEAYTVECGTARVDSGYVTVDGYKLGAWAVHQRAARRKGTLQPDRAARLEALPGWVWDRYAADFEANFARLEAYVAEHGHARPPLGYRTRDGCRVGQWVVANRSRRSELPPERQARLEALPGWAWNTKDAAWEEWFGLLEVHVTEHGHARPPDDYTSSGGQQLGAWVRTQRRRQKKLPPERKQRLEALPGWVWSVTAAAWEDGFARLEAYTVDHGTAQPPQTHKTEDGYPLGTWVAKQRRMRTRGELQPDRSARLEALPGWSWHPKNTAWEDAFVRLEAYAAEHGTARPTTEYVAEDGHRLGFWVVTQRNFYRRGKLEKSRAERLETLPGWAWDTYEAGWDEAFARLEAYTAEHGHARPPASYNTDDGFYLGQWVIRQQDARRRLARSKIARLERLPGWAWTAYDTDWEEAFARLEAYAAEHGHAGPPPSYKTTGGFPLGPWVNTQRTTRRKGSASLTPERQARLEALPGWEWDPKVAAWQDGYDHLVEYADEHGTARVPAAHVTDDGYRLGQWTKYQRGVRNRGELSAEREARLETLPGWVWVVRGGS